MSAYAQLQAELNATPRTWLVTGVAGFIGSNLLETLLNLDQRVVGLDNLSHGKRFNLTEVQRAVGAERWARFRFVQGDICDLEVCKQVCVGVDYVLHQAALGSVPRSMADPIGSHRVNVDGFLNMLVAACDAPVRRFVYASSSAVYGDAPGLPKFEDKIGQPLSPYAATKWINEIYAEMFGRVYNFPTIGLRYFNVFGPRQDPDGDYAAVISKWIAELLKRQPVQINGDGETTRDFCFVNNVVQANLLAATTTNPAALNQAYNIAVGQRTSLNELFRHLNDGLRRRDLTLPDAWPVYQNFRAGDVRHSQADISKAQSLLGYAPTHQIGEGIEAALDWYRRNVA